MQRVFVLDSNKKPLSPCRPKRARELLRDKKAAVFRRFPFTIILKKEITNISSRSYRIKIDPGSKTTGLAVISDFTGEVVFAAELEHRGNAISLELEKRRNVRRGRRFRNTRYRRPPFKTRRKYGKGWLPPSIKSRVTNIITWVNRFRKFSNITNISQELVKFDTQKMENPEISGVEYQQGTLVGYEVREYLLEKYNRECVYCGKKDVPFEIDHVHPKSKGGTNRVSNLVLSCHSCNIKKNNNDIKLFLKGKPELLKSIMSGCKNTLKDASAVNSTRFELYSKLKEIGLEVEVGSGALTKYNRSIRKLPKEHWIDAICVGKSTPIKLDIRNIKVLKIKAVGYGSRQMCLMDSFGFPRSKSKGSKVVQGFRTGDMVKAVVTKGKKIGIYSGKVAIRSSGCFNIDTGKKIIEGISYKYCKKIFSMDGYSYGY